MASPKQEEKNSPPPPPPAPPPSNPRSKISPYVLKLRSAPLDYFYQAPEKPPAVDFFAAPTGPYFFYGTLTDPLMLARFLSWSRNQSCAPHTLWVMNVKCGVNIPPCSIVRALLSKAQPIMSVLRRMQRGLLRMRLEAIVLSLVLYTDRKDSSEDRGYTFKFVGNPKELSEGEFDLNVWLRRMGRQAAADKLDTARREM